MNTHTRFCTVMAVVTVLFSASALAATEMPRLQFGHGDVKAISIDGKSRPLKKGDVLRPGEKLVTGPGAMAQLRLFKQGVVVLRDQSQMELKPEIDGRYRVALDKGLMRTVTKLGFRLGKIDVATPVAQIAVQSGDMLTGVGVDNSARTTTHSHVFDGLVKIKTGNQEQVADRGKIFQVNPIGGAITTLKKVPDSMKLTLPEPTKRSRVILDQTTRKMADRAYDIDQTKIVVLDRPVTKTLGKGQLNVPGAFDPKGRITTPTVAKTGGKKVYSANNFDRTKLYQLETKGDLLGKNGKGPFVLDYSSSRDGRTIMPVKTSKNTNIKKLTRAATPVNLKKTVKVAGETTLSSPVLPIKVVTFEPEKIVKSSNNYNKELVKTIKQPTRTTTPVKTVKNPVKNPVKTPVRTIKTPIKTTTKKSLSLIPKF